jgi:glycosyltransferase involved in cell wall biosynthesis
MQIIYHINQIDRCLGFIPSNTLEKSVACAFAGKARNINMSLKLLIIAPTCDGQDVGEAWVAYQWVRRLAARNDVTLLTYHKRGKIPASEQLQGMRVIEWPEPAFWGRAERLNSMLKPGYISFYRKARQWIRDAIGRGERFDLAHQLVPVAMRYPSPVAGLGIPYLIGPVGGSLDTPAGFDEDRETAPWYVGLRRLDKLRIRLDPFLRETYEDASCIIGIAPYVGDFLKQLSIRRLELLSETGLESLPQPIDRSNRTGPVRLLFVGRLVRTKGVRDAIRAMAHLGDLPVRLDVVGDGFDRAKCESLVSELGLSDKVTLHGRKSRNNVEGFYRAADIFVFPSYREPGGNVVFEAMGWGLPLIVSDLGGPGAAVDESSGIRIHPVDPKHYAQEIANAIRRLVTDRDLRLSLGNGARVRVAETALWDQKVEKIGKLYEEILERGICRPFGEHT